MITTVMFDMGGTLEDVYVDDESSRQANEKLRTMLMPCGLDAAVDAVRLKAITDKGWKDYGDYRDARQVELKPVGIWCDFVLKGMDLDFAKVAAIAEDIASMWELTYYHRSLRPHVKEMLTGLQGLGLKLGVISNTAAMFQVFDVLESYGIRDFFKDVTLSSVTGLRKPNTDIFRVSLRQLRSKPEECYYVGDTVSRDIIGARRAGYAGTIQICSHLTAWKDAGVKREFEPDYVVQDIGDVYTIISRLTGR